VSVVSKIDRQVNVKMQKKMKCVGGAPGGAIHFFQNHSLLFNHGIERISPEKMVKIRSVVLKLLLLIC